MKRAVTCHLLSKDALLILVAMVSSAVEAHPTLLATPKSPPVASREVSYAERLILAIKRNILWTTEGDISDAICEVEATIDAQGWIVSRGVLKSHGHPGWCPTVLKALDRTERIPADSYGRFPPKLSITFYGKE